MATPATRQTVLHLYRKILRAGKNWEGPEEEAFFIIEEACEKFRRNASLTDARDIEKQIKYAENRLNVATHYKIPFERPIHTIGIPEEYKPPKPAVNIFD